MKRCISLLEKNEKILIEKLQNIQKNTAELIEIRLDFLKNPDLAKILKNAKLPVIISTRNDKNWEKYLEAIALKVAYIDVDISLPKKFFQKNKKTKLIISYHDHEKTPSEIDLKNILKKINSAGADIAKIATHIKTSDDNIRLLDLLAKESEKRKLIIHGMGEKGKIGRVLAALLGSEISYLAIDEKSKTAKGQWTLQKWNRIFGNNEI